MEEQQFSLQEEVSEAKFPIFDRFPANLGFDSIPLICYKTSHLATEGGAPEEFNTFYDGRETV